MADFSDAESEAPLKSLGHMHGNETRAETVERLQAVIKFAGHAPKADAPKKRAKTRSRG